jgi:hypothetical protein
VDVDFGFVGEVVVDDMSDAVDVDAAAGYVGGYQHGDFVVGEIGESALAGILAFVAVDGFGADATGVEMTDDAVGAVLGSGEDEGAVHREILDEVREEGGLVAFFYPVDGFFDLGGGGFNGGDFDDGGFVHQGVGEAADFGGHGGGEEERLAFGGELGDDAADGLDEAHVEHAVGFVEN